MNAPFIPDSHGTYADGVYALLTILSDPAKHKARLDELLAQENAVKEQIAALNDMAADTRRLHTSAEAATIVLNNRKTTLDEREKTLDLNSAAALKRREAAIQIRENAAALEEKRLAALKTDLEDKHAKIKHLATGLS